MRKILLKNEEDLKTVISHFGDECKDKINDQVSMYPCVLIAYQNEEFPFGDSFLFTSITKKDLDKKPSGCLSYIFPKK